ncbi:hypothetical protein PFICI_10463 [Pestalotiopsis fici W106-1]|uniref:Uncharacterized protein n=1 Tax=Pestalotiopsis fici (strain W106-1 / CGMCC3.15140) TaxID=1229662 RepID=W3WZT7_PESFW|nr:uncharacterized protein PFICI_10463 [Pestalotiopsis fici W106-1]ETS78401.1 hypothetical protein PFICI_10463 [Pestalotiopsis fici W106-1]
MRPVLQLERPNFGFDHHRDIMSARIQDMEDIESDHIPTRDLARISQRRHGVPAVQNAPGDIGQTILEHYGQMPLGNSLPIPPRPPTPSPGPRPGPLPPRPGPTPPPSP